MLTYMGGMLVSPLNKEKKSSCSHNNLTISDCEPVQLYIIYLDYL